MFGIQIYTIHRANNVQSTAEPEKNQSNK